ncbi:MAG TPA: head-tail connector protein [Methylovirgula sp.]|nr:head-tail connector protein [Methylovirgula sp.]
MPSPYDLTDLADLKAWLDVQSDDDDAVLASLITQLSRAILSRCDRASILPTLHEETRDGGDEDAIVLRQWPVTAIQSLTINGSVIRAASALVPGGARTPGYVLEAPGRAPPGRMQKLSLRGLRFLPGAQNVSVAYQAGYQICGEAALVPLSAPYTVVAQAPYGAWASDCSVAYANGVMMMPVAANPAAGQYVVQGGTYQFAAADADRAVVLDYGYVPADLAFCALDWAAELYAYRDRIGLRSKSLGGQESVSFIVKDIPDFVESALQPYRRIVLP